MGVSEYVFQTQFNRDRKGVRVRRTPFSGPHQEEAFQISPVDHVIADAAQDLFARLLNRYLPDQNKGYVGDDEPTQSAPPVPATDPHRVLGLKVGASAVEIKRRLRQLARVFHPDVEGGNADKMAEVNDAVRELLSRAGTAAG
jgi:hypothetical protein